MHWNGEPIKSFPLCITWLETHMPNNRKQIVKRKAQTCRDDAPRINLVHEVCMIALPIRWARNMNTENSTKIQQSIHHSLWLNNPKTTRSSQTRPGNFQTELNTSSRKLSVRPRYKHKLKFKTKISHTSLA